MPHIQEQEGGLCSFGLGIKGDMASTYVAADASACARSPPLHLQQTWREQNSWMDQYRTRLGPYEGYGPSATRYCMRLPALLRATSLTHGTRRQGPACAQQRHWSSAGA